MFHLGNNPQVSLETRRWLGELARQAILLDKDSRELMISILDHCLQTSPCGMVFDLTIHHGATQEKARVVSSISEIFYAVCSYTDDLQDGDADRYFTGTSFAVQLNVQTHLHCLLTVRLQDLARTMTDGAGLDALVDIFKYGAAMLCGQRIELLRDPWNIEIYEEVARRIAGYQYGAHFSLIAHGAGARSDKWAPLGIAYGTLLQLIVDYETSDERLLVLEQHEISRLQARLVEQLLGLSRQNSQTVQKYVEALIKRCPETL